MEKRVMVALVGEQPIPNVLPVSHFRPHRVALVCTQHTEWLADRIGEYLGEVATKPFCVTDPYLVDVIVADLQRYIQGQRWSDAELLFNLTGGTKAMAFAALEVARAFGQGAWAFYWQTGASDHVLHRFRFSDGRLRTEPPIHVAPSLTIEDFLRLHVGRYRLEEFRNDFERNVAAVLEGLGPDYEFWPNVRLSGIGHGVEVDGILRLGSTFGVFEVKLRAKKSDGLDQLRSVTEQRTLGTYTKRFLVTSDPMHRNDMDLAEAYRVTVATLPSGRQAQLSAEDVGTLTEVVTREMTRGN